MASKRQQLKMHTLRSSKSTTYSYSRCVMCVCLNMWVHVYVYMSAWEQCYRLCNNSILFKLYNEKFRSATYITMFAGVCQLRVLTIIRAETRLTICERPKTACDCAGDPVIVVKLSCCDCVTFLKNMEQYYKPNRYPYYNCIHRMHSNNSGCSSTHGAYQSDPLLFDIKGAHSYWFIPVNISNSIIAYILSIVLGSGNLYSCIHARKNWHTCLELQEQNAVPSS